MAAPQVSFATSMASGCASTSVHRNVSSIVPSVPSQRLPIHLASRPSRQTRALIVKPTARLHASKQKSSGTYGVRDLCCRAVTGETVVFTAEKLAGTYKATKGKPTVVVTRELGNNGKLVKKLTKLGIECIELPLIEHAPAEDRALLGSTLAAGGWDWVIATSPEGAKVLLEGWEEAGKPDLKIAVVGEGTSRALTEHSPLDIAFVPSTATGEVLAAELPAARKGERVLYAASDKAGTDIQAGLQSRDFEVVRLNTYTTRAVESVDSDVLKKAMEADVVTFASPSTIKAWLKFVGEKATDATSPKVACIGVTSAKACEKYGLKNVFFPEKPGIDGWVESVLEALQGSVTSKSI